MVGPRWENRRFIPPSRQGRPVRFKFLLPAVVVTLMLVWSAPAALAQGSWTVTDAGALGPQAALTLAQHLAGTGVTVTGATYVGASRAAGLFTADPSVIGFGDGVILSTGDIRNVVDQTSPSLFAWPPGPNSSTTLISTINGTP